MVRLSGRDASALGAREPPAGGNGARPARGRAAESGRRAPRRAEGEKTRCLAPRADRGAEVLPRTARLRRPRAAMASARPAKTLGAERAIRDREDGRRLASTDAALAPSDLLEMPGDRGGRRHLRAHEVRASAGALAA